MNRIGSVSQRKEPVFIQAFNQLHYQDPSVLRNRERAWVVEFQGEGAEDAGGPYRESMSYICQELHSEQITLSLFIPCPNAREGTGQNIDQWIPNPSAVDVVSLAQYEFVGKLMGVAIRTGEPLNLNVSSFFWKQMVGAPLESRDLFSFDVRVGELLKGLAKGALIKEGNVTITFTTKLSDNSEVELKPNGKSIRVSESNVTEYIQRVEYVRLHECEKQVAAISKGLATMVPIKVSKILQLVTL